jgi:hypothetical protein
MTPEEQLLEMIQLGVGQAVINGFCLANGLHVPQPDPRRIVMRPVVAVSSPRPRRRSSRKATTAKKTATPATSKSRVETRFDLKD